MAMATFNLLNNRDWLESQIAKHSNLSSQLSLGLFLFSRNPIQYVSESGNT